MYYILLCMCIVVLVPLYYIVLWYVVVPSCGAIVPGANQLDRSRTSAEIAIKLELE